MIKGIKEAAKKIFSQAPQKPSSAQAAFNYKQQGRDWINHNAAEQSPIDIPAPSIIKKPDFHFKVDFRDQEQTGLRLYDTGFQLRMDGNFSVLEGETMNGNSLIYEDVQFHFHAPSEHTY
mmetsp:Transcript_24219/g.21326  ORF Transcript_24219/g.21326 Transcript_24219/m.21326 type:complete len:120 (+) Transcript_24219:78-437(+)